MEGRRRITLYDQMKAGDTSSSRNSLASFLDDVVLASQKSRNQTLFDIIREDEPNSSSSNNNNTRNSWKAFKDMLRLKRRNADESTHQQRDDVIGEGTENSDPTELLAGGESSDEDNNDAETRQVSMSLMDLLEETKVDLDPRSDDDADNIDGDGGGVDADRKLEEEEEEEKEEEEREGGVEVKRGGVAETVEYNCCVCMVRHKGAAFIPCGHTFCRMCSRELWVSRGNCPLCNNFILEILDIF